MKTITVKVTEEHIRDGKPCSFGSCPIALALAGMGLVDVGVGVYTGYFREPGPNGWNRAFPLPAEASEFVEAFDNRQPVIPFVFSLEYPERPSAG